MKHIDLMLDLETLSLDSYAVITQISAVPFELSKGILGDFRPFNELINPISSARAGAKIDGSTIEWWFKQEDSVIQKVFMESLQNGKDVRGVLEGFSDYIKSLKTECDVKNVYLWGNGVKADNVWLENQYKLLGMKYPVTYRDDMDVRTLMRLGKELGIDLRDGIKFVGEKHNAIDDCNHQIEYVCRTFNAIKELTDKGSTK